MTHVTAGPYTLEIPPNGVATLYEADGAGNYHQLPGGVGYLDALVQFAGEVIRLRAMIECREYHAGEGVSLPEKAIPSSSWRLISDATDQSAAPWDGVPVLIVTNHNWGGPTNRVHRAFWTDEIHGHGIFGWAVQDCKFGPYPLRGYTQVTHWMPLPTPPKAAPMTAGKPMSSLAQRCLAFYQQQGRDAMLRQGDPVQAIYDFVLSEISRAADSKLDDKEALVLYFKTPEDRAEFVAAIMEAKPNMISRKWPR